MVKFVLDADRLAIRNFATQVRDRETGAARA